MAEVFVVGSINRDFVLKVERRPEPGETVTGAALSLHDGGKGANQAAAAALLGASVAFLGRVGDDGLGGPLLRALSEKGVDTDLSETVEGYSTGAALITVTPDGENAITVVPGANHALSPGDVDAATDAIREANVLVAQMEIPCRVVGRAAELAYARGARVLLNLAPSFEVPGSLLERLVCDVGLPIPSGPEGVDLAFRFGVPSFETVLSGLLDELVVEGATAADEVGQNPVTRDLLAARFPELELVPHEELKKRVAGAKVVVRTGEATPYSNVILRCGVPF